jgi:co-chaperonin GroES (HSP10)
MKLKAFGDRVLATMIDRPDGYKKTHGGLLMNDKDGETTAIRPRWFRVKSIGERVDFVNEGQYILVAHGRWSNGVDIDDQKIYLIDNEEILGTSNTNPMED